MPDSSPEPVVDETTTDTSANAEPNTDGQTAESSTAETAGTMFEAVKTALASKEESPTSEEPDQKAEVADPDSKAEPEESDDLSAEELKAVSQKTRTRFSRLKSKLDAKDVELSTLKPKADEFEKINQFVTNAGLKNEEVSFLLTVGALTKSNPAKALEQLLPLMQQLQQQAGDVLPSDLQEQVRLGYITEAYARELNKSKAGERLAREQLEQSDTAKREAEQQRQQQTLIDTTLAATEKWEARHAEKDPDWHLKRKEVSEKVEFAILKEQQKRGVPWFPTSAEAVQLADNALKDINVRFKRYSSKPNEIRPVAGGASGRTTAKPGSMIDVVRNAIGG